MGNVFSQAKRWVMIRAMMVRYCFRLACVSMLVIITSNAWADCTEPPGPGVNWRRCYMDERHFLNVDLTGSVLREASFARADLSGSKLAEIDGRRVKFFTAYLADTVFDGARMIEADFTRADLRGSSFRGADLRRVRFFRAQLKGADFTGARLDGADLLSANLTGATWTDGKTICAKDSIGQCN